ncbi:Clp protease ClpP [Flagellimonas onchidii]|uniref:Clp protease ClpP n=1 Tax=Flagellimonas onchidii TaxID=2562684 RepID=UPI0010A5AA7E|nr:Clp protease ClpP [Allomuricauda onchidii]
MIVKVDQNNIHIYGYLYHGDGIRFLGEFSKIDGTYPEIEVYLHTYGGSVFDGNMIFNTLTTAKSQVNTNIIGVGASMGAILSQAGKVRRQVSNGFMMIHAATGGTYGTAKDHLSSANLLTEIEKQFIQLLVSKTGLKAKEVKKWLVGDNWFSAGQAKKEGLIDEIIDPLATLEIDIDDPESIGSEEVYNRFAASLKIKDSKPVATQNEPSQELKSKDVNMKKDVIRSLGLQNINGQSSDTAVISAIEEHINAKVNDYKTKYENERTARENLETAINAQRDAKIKAILDKAENVDKTITAKQRKDIYEPIGKNTGLEALEAVLGGLKPHKSITAQVGGKPSTVTAQDGWDWDKYQKENPKALEALKKDDPDAFAELFKAKFGVDYKE